MREPFYGKNSEYLYLCVRGYILISPCLSRLSSTDLSSHISRDRLKNWEGVIVFVLMHYNEPEDFSHQDDVIIIAVKGRLNKGVTKPQRQKNKSREWAEGGGKEDKRNGVAI